MKNYKNIACTNFVKVIIALKKLYGPFFMNGVQLPQGYKRQFTFYH